MHETILVVDDRLDTLNLLSTSLIQLGYVVLTATSGEEGLRKLKSGRVSLVILDLMMPGMTGQQVLDEIRKNKDYDKVKVLLLTALRINDVEQKALLKRGAQGFLTKPIAMESLEKEIKMALAKKA